MYYFDSLDTPIGTLRIIVSDRGVSGILFSSERGASGLVQDSTHPLIVEAKQQLSEYFKSARETFDLPLDLAGTSFQKKAWGVLRSIPYGSTIDYAEEARRAKNPKAVRAVGSANAKNPIPIIIPCHRVIKKGEHIGRYSGGVKRKAFLIQMEKRGVSRVSRRVILGAAFFRRPTLLVGRELIGKFLVRRWRGGEHAYMITDVEVYDGPNDKASHASRGRTARNEVMFGPPGVWYVYLVYGMHNMLNIVTREKDYPATILLRGLEGISGPGCLTAVLHVSRALNKKLAERSFGLWIEDRGVHIPASRVTRTPRIGVSYAGEHWAKKPWRFFLKRPFS